MQPWRGTAAGRVDRWPWIDAIRHRWRSARPPTSPRVGWAWLAAGLLLLVTALLTVRAQRAAEQSRAAWGEQATVWLATADLPAGLVLGEQHVRPVQLPRAVIPASALPAGDAPSPVGRRVLEPVVAGEVLVSPRLASPDDPRTAIGPGQVGLALPADLAPPGVRPGDPVAVLVVGGADGGGSALVMGTIIAPPGAAPATAVLVVDVDHAPLVATALRRGDLVIGQLGGPLAGPAGLTPPALRPFTDPTRSTG
jgi:hypothetical protein